MTRKPALSLVAVPGRRKATLELAQRIEKEGYSGIFSPSVADNMGFCQALAQSTREIVFGTSIANMYTRHPHDYAQHAALIHELSGGRFRFGVGVSHGPTHARLKIQVGKPLADTRQFVADLRSAPSQIGPLPPIVLATLRRKMLELAGEIADGAVWANAARSHMKTSLSYLPEAKRKSPGFFIGNMVPTVIDDDRAAAAAVNRKTLINYVKLTNYQNYWIEAGYEDEMLAIRKALAEGREHELPSLMSDRWLKEVTLFGNAKEVREGIEAWYDTGINSLIVVPSSTKGGQMVAFEEVMAALRS